ncbi:MAG: hypothetical protein WCP03_03770 [Candidatus Saccharibacteria bacterium]
MASTGTKKGTSKKIWWIVGGVLGFFVLLFILAAIFGSPSADKVFKDMSEEMLKTKSVTVSQTYKGSGTGGESINMTSKMYLNMATSELLARGNFAIDMVSSGTPMNAEAEFISIGSNSYIKFTKLSSSSPTLTSSFSQIESKLKNNWVKSKEGDSFSAFAKLPTDSIMSVLPVPFANLNDSQRKNVLTILQDKSMYTIEESSKVDIGGVSAYKYSVKYDKDLYNKAAKAITGYLSYFKSSGTDDSEIKTLTVWVNTKTSQIIKIEFTGTAKQGDVQGTITFTDYNQNLPIEKPSDYSIESELLN